MNELKQPCFSNLCIGSSSFSPVYVMMQRDRTFAFENHALFFTKVSRNKLKNSKTAPGAELSKFD